MSNTEIKQICHGTGLSMKILGSALFSILFLTACASNIGGGVGIAGVSNDGIAGTEIIADSESGVHGSVVMGTDIYR